MHDEQPMTPEEKKKLVEEAFLLGFMCSREGFNGECAFEHCADTPLKPYAGTEAEFRDGMATNEVFNELRSEAVTRLCA